MIRVGDMVTSKPVRTWLGDNSGCRQVCVIDPDGAWNEPTSTADLITRADPVALLSAFAAQLADRIEVGSRGGWLRPRRQRLPVDSFLDRLGDELFEPRVHRDLGALVPPRSTVFVASSMPIRDLETFLPSSERELRFLANRGANGIDGMVSSGLGAAAVARGGPMS